ncbi:hypothetical protein DTL42_13905 [Bremerella cremea]|uniref:Cytochrome C Planctomycete-type domain-containing protein n=1 Tax=Bremerella cremea TaxID=1031537 RepID=A0A368KRV4_9BACT|nr:c-type cytochrome domain-containing protein [Bremerella cremea]RCS47615.1 hypothetical protein DTL42_13905 [Bremerella cremea]
MNHYLSAAFVLLSLAAQSALAAEPTVSFRQDIAPILLENCQACHGAKKAEGGYRVDSYAELLKAGDSGEIPIAEDPNDPSELLRRIACEDEFERMPPESDPLPADKIALVQQWIAAGGKFDGDNPEQTLGLVIPPPTYAAPPEKYTHAVPLTAITFSPDGKQVIVGGYHELTVWNAEDATLARRIPNLGQRIFALSFSPDGETLAVGCGEAGQSGEVRLVNFASGEVKGVIARTNDVVLDVAFRPGTPEIAVAAADSSLRIINTQTLAEVRAIASHADWVNAVAWSDDGSLLVSGSRDKSAKVYQAETGELLASYVGHGAAVRGVSVLPDNKHIVSVGADNKLHRWQVADAKKVAEVPLGSEGQKVLRVANDLFVPCAGQRLVRINLADNKITQEYKGHGDWVLAIAQQPGEVTDPSGRLLASGSFDGELRLWKVSDATPVRNWIAKP